MLLTKDAANVGQDCPKQDNTSDCGAYVAVAILHRVMKLPLPLSVDASLWRRLFRAALGDNTNNVTPDMISGGSEIFDIILPDRNEGQASAGLDHCSSVCTTMLAAIHDRLTSYERRHEQAQQMLSRAQAAHAILARCLGDAADAQRRLAAQLAAKQKLVQLHEGMQRQLGLLRRENGLDGDGDGGGAGEGVDDDVIDSLGSELAQAIKSYQAPSQALDDARARLRDLHAKRDSFERRRNGLLAALRAVEAECEARAWRAGRLKEGLDDARGRAREFFQAQIVAFQRGVDRLGEGSGAV